jgi:amino acid adenylation domain-containing protein
MSDAAFDLWDIVVPEDDELYARLNDTRRVIDRRTLAGRTLEVAARRPDAVAVETAQGSLSYGELVRRAAGVAAGLTGRGLRTGDVCAIFLDKRPELYPVLLGAHLAGLVVAPLDTSAPPARLARCLSLVDARLLVTARDLAGGAPDTVPTIMCDDGWPPAADVVDRATWSGGAYVMFTSGTTGTPKPVLVGHAGLANLALGMAEVFDVGAESRVTHVAPVHFDPTWQQVGAAWTRGATLLPVPDRVRADPELMSRWLVDRRVTHCSSVPSLWNPVARYLAEHPAAPRPLALRVQGLGGEQLDPGHVRMWRDHVSARTRIVNVYGPIEATVTATVHTVDSAETGSVVPIGEPLPNLRAYVLDDALNLCPPGVGGQLFLGGDGLAAGYVAAARETAASFLPDPFAGEPGARMYATGDRARLLTTGHLVFDGRADTMVKVHGVRVELEEVEAVMRTAPGVDAAAVIAGAGGLIGFFASASGVDADTVYRTVGELLPASSIPTRLIALPGMPVGATGKLDRPALAARAAAPAEPETGAARPETPAERTLAAIWSEVLGLDEIGVDDNFFSLGGDSIASIVARDRALDAGMAFEILDLFRSPTIRKLAALARPAQREPAADPLGSGDSGLLPLLPGQETIYRTAAAQQDQAGSCIQETFRLSGEIDADCLEAAVNLLVERHAALRASFESRDGRPWQRITDRPRVTVHVYADPAGDGESALATARREALRRIALDSWPLFDLSLVRAGGGRSALLWTTHHVFMDGWSQALLRDELFTAYVAISEGMFTVAEPAPDDLYVQHLRTYADRPSEDAEHHRFWRDYLADCTPLRIPRDGAGGDGRFGRIGLEIDAATRRGIAALARDQGRSENTVLIAATARALQQLAGTDDVTILYVSSGRARFERSQATVGCLVNTGVPVRVRAPAGLDLAALLRTAGESLAAVLPHESAPLSLVCDAAARQSVRDISEVLFLYQNYPETGTVDELAASGRHGFTIDGYESDEAAQLPITITCHPLDGGRLAVDIAYWTSVFSREDIRPLGELLDEAISAGVAG